MRRATPSTGSRVTPTERDFLYVTTAQLTPEQLQQLNDEVVKGGVKVDHWGGAKGSH